MVIRCPNCDTDLNLCTKTTLKIDIQEENAIVDFYCKICHHEFRCIFEWNQHYISY